MHPLSTITPHHSPQLILYPPLHITIHFNSFYIHPVYHIHLNSTSSIIHHYNLQFLPTHHISTILQHHSSQLQLILYPLHNSSQLIIYSPCVPHSFQPHLIIYPQLHTTIHLNFNSSYFHNYTSQFISTHPISTMCTITLHNSSQLIIYSHCVPHSFQLHLILYPQLHIIIHLNSNSFYIHHYTTIHLNSNSSYIHHYTSPFTTTPLHPIFTLCTPIHLNTNVFVIIKFTILTICISHYIINYKKMRCTIFTLIII